MFSNAISVQRLCNCLNAIECVLCEPIQYISECFRTNQVLVNEIASHTRIAFDQTIYGVYGFDAYIGAHIQWLRFEQIQPISLEFYYHQLIRSQSMNFNNYNFLDLFESCLYQFGNHFNVHPNHVFSAYNNHDIDEEYWYNTEHEFLLAFANRILAQHEQQPGLRLPVDEPVPLIQEIIDEIDIDMESDESGIFDNDEYE